MRTLFLVALGLAGNAARGDAGFYATRAAFDAATDGRPRFTEDFDARLPGFDGDSGLNPASLAFAGGGGLGFTASGGTLLYQSLGHGFAGTPFLGVVANGLYLRLDFAGGVTAFSGHFFNTLIDDSFYPGQAVTLLLDNGDTVTRTPESVADSFVGYVSEGPAIRSARLADAADFENGYSNVDRVTVVGAGPPAAATPLPPTLPAALVGLLAAAVNRRGRPGNSGSAGCRPRRVPGTGT